ncbi:thiamine pyrophosphate-dependent dehydrogenase E1 component subunit alpha [Chloroflexota bacterium]
MTLNDEQLLNIYRKMVLLRRFEEKAGEVFYAGRMPGFVHLAEGQEASEVGVCSALRSDDWITVPHRGDGIYLAKGADPKELMAELFGRSTGYSGGRGGHMHVAVPEFGILGGYGVVGGGIPIACGAALSEKMRGGDRVSVAFFGDGAVNQGTFHESLNLASCWNLPVLFVCENNGWAITTRIQNTCMLENIADRSKAYNIPGVSVDGNDVIAVYEASEEAVERARLGEGPTLLECKTYRIRSHSEGLDIILKNRPYRDESEINEWKTRDPIRRFQSNLLEKGILNSDLVDSIELEVGNEVSEAVSYAEQSPWPAPEDALLKVFA